MKFIAQSAQSNPRKRLKLEPQARNANPGTPARNANPGNSLHKLCQQAAGSILQRNQFSNPYVAENYSGFQTQMKPLNKPCVKVAEIPSTINHDLVNPSEKSTELNVQLAQIASQIEQGSFNKVDIQDEIIEISTQRSNSKTMYRQRSTTISIANIQVSSQKATDVGPTPTRASSYDEVAKIATFTKTPSSFFEEFIQESMLLNKDKMGKTLDDAIVPFD